MNVNGKFGSATPLPRATSQATPLPEPRPSSIVSGSFQAAEQPAPVRPDPTLVESPLEENLTLTLFRSTQEDSPFTKITLTRALGYKDYTSDYTLTVNFGTLSLPDFFTGSDCATDVMRQSLELLETYLPEQTPYTDKQATLYLQLNDEEASASQELLLYIHTIMPFSELEQECLVSFFSEWCIAVGRPRSEDDLPPLTFHLPNTIASSLPASLGGGRLREAIQALVDEGNLSLHKAHMLNNLCHVAEKKDPKAFQIALTTAIKQGFDIHHPVVHTVEFTLTLGDLLLEQVLDFNDTATIQYLISRGIEVNKPLLDGMTLLLNAINTERNNDLCRLLLKNGADPNQTDPKGRTPLMYAANSIGWSLEDVSPVPITLSMHENALKIFPILLEAGANPTIGQALEDKDMDNDTFEFKAYESGLPYLEQAVLNHAQHIQQTTVRENMKNTISEATLLIPDLANMAAEYAIIPAKTYEEACHIIVKHLNTKDTQNNKK